MKEFVHTGRKLLASRKFQEAVKVCRLGLLEHPGSTDGRLVLAQALMSLARYDEVLAEARVALEQNPESAPATVLMGEALFFKGAYSQAREVLKRAAELDETNATVARLLDELDATVEVGIEETPSTVDDQTRSYPQAPTGMDVGDQTEIQDLPPAMLQHGDAPIAPAPPADSGEPADRDPDEDRPDPIAGEVDVPDPGAVRTPVTTSDVKVDVSKVGELASQPPSGSEHPDDDPILLTPPLAEEQPADEPLQVDPRELELARRESSQSGARRWANRKWLEPEEAATREAILVPTPSITTEEMRDSDLFGRDMAGDETRSLKPVVVDDSLVEEPPEGDATRPTRLSKPERSPPRQRPERPPEELPSVVAEQEDPWENEDEETRPLRPVTPVKAPPQPGRRGSLARSKPAPPPPPPAPKSPFAPPAPGPRRSPPPGAARMPPPPGLRPQATPGLHKSPPSPRPVPPPADPNLDFTGVNFEAPPAAPPGSSAPPKSVLSTRPVRGATSAPARPASAAQAGRPITPQAGPRVSAAGGPAVTPQASPRAVGVRGPAPKPQASPSPLMEATRRPAMPPSKVERTSPAARRPRRRKLSGRWRVYLLLAGLAGLLATVILVTVALRKGRQSEAIQRHHRNALRQLETASFASLKQADTELRRLLRESPGDRAAKSLRAFVVSTSAVEFGVEPERAEQILLRGGARDDDLLSGARILTALAKGDLKAVDKHSQEAKRRWPKSAYVSYARGVAELQRGWPARALSIFESAAPGKAKSLLLRNKIRAVLALRQHKDVATLLATIPEKHRPLPWAALLAVRCLLAKPKGAVTVKGLDGAVSVTADTKSRVSAQQKRWAHLLLADGYGRLSRPRSRKDHITRARAGGPIRDPALGEALAAHLLHWNLPQDAQQLAQTIRARFPDRLVAAVVQAQATLALGEAKLALTQLKNIPPKRVTSAILLLRARAHLQLGQLEQSRTILVRLRRQYPDMTGASITWAKLLTRQGRLNDALAELEDVLKREPRNVDVIRTAAGIELRLGKAADAVTRMEEAVRLRARDPLLRAELVQAYLAAGNFKSAKTSVESAVSVFHSSPEVLTSKGRLLQALGQFDAALKAFDAALKKKPKLTDARLGRAETLLTAGRVKPAQKAVAKAIQVSPEARKLLQGWLALERWSKRRGDYYKARTRLTAAAAKKSAQGLRAGILLLEYYAKRMAKRAAESAYQRLTERHGAQPGLRAALALVLLEVDANRAAISQLKSVLSDARLSRLSPVIQAEARARLGQAYWQAGSFGPAATQARKALSLWSGCARAHAVLGIVAYEMAKFRRARKHLRRAVKANPNLALPFHYLGRANQALGQRRTGRKHLRQYLRLRPKGPLAADSRKAMYR